MRKCEKSYILGKKFNKFIPKNDALTFGSAYHKCIEDGDLTEGIKMLEEAGLDDKIELLEEMVIRLFDGLNTHKIELIENEHEFNIEVPGTSEKLHGFIDGIAMRDGKKVLVEFKTAANLDISTLRIDAQITCYLYAARELGLTDGTEMLYIINLKKKDKKPTILKNGSLSTAKTQGCSPDAYYNAIIDMYGEFETAPAKVQECHRQLVLNYTPLLAVIKVTRTPFELDKFGEMIKKEVIREGELKELIEEVGTLYAFDQAFAMPGKFGCQMCDVKGACVELTCSNEDYSEDELDQAFIDGLFMED
jgi:hypothetical protein